VHQIVQRHHGRITVTSTPGRGTLFVLELPAP
jgi:signal transduction histidine kinase